MPLTVDLTSLVLLAAIQIADPLDPRVYGRVAIQASVKAYLVRSGLA